MPLNAINAGVVDHVLSPPEIAQELRRIVAHSYFGDAPFLAGNPEAFTRILARLRSRTGVDFSHYRTTTLERRIARRMALARQNSLSEYAQWIEENSGEVEALFRDCLIHVTSFFRDPMVFDALKQVVFPQIVSKKPPEVPIRIWAAGCSTGQEAYSLAMVFLEYLEQHGLQRSILIFGTDLGEATAVEKARTGLYSHAIESEVSPERLKRFFIRENEGFRVSKAVRDTCIFARHNVITDPPFSRLDLICCRNLLIYLNGTLQQRLIPAFHYALNPGGFLLLGNAESVGRYSDLFAPADKKHNIFSRLNTITRPYPLAMGDDSPHHTPSAVPVGERMSNMGDIQKEADRVVLGQYAPPGVLINEEFQILQFRGRTGPYLEPPPGEASYDLLKMARESLFMDLRSAVDEAKKGNARIRRHGVLIRDARESRPIDLEIIPIRPSAGGGRCFLVLFIELAGPTDVFAGKGAPGPAPRMDDETDVGKLRQELASAREYMQAVIDQQRATNEELQSANEEVRSSNEELQSTNEELQTAKEELQSSNEELRTVNEELKSRNQEVSVLNDDLTNTLSSIKLPVILLGHNLHIRRFTPVAGKLMNLLPTDVGRPFGDLSPAFEIPHFIDLLHNVMTTAVGEERVCQDRNGRWQRIMMSPYRTADRRIDGVVLVILDIDESERARARLSVENTALQGRVSESSAQLSATSTQLNAQMTEYAKLESQISQLVDAERINFGIEMHDNLCQQLAATGLLASSLSTQLQEEGKPQAALAARIAESLSRANVDAHRMAKGLLPVQVNAHGLTMAVGELMEQTRENAGIVCTLDCPDEVTLENNSIATHLFRILQEAVQNTIKHASARHLYVSISSNNGVTLIVRDDGVGFPPATDYAPGNGLRIMRYRARQIGAELSVGPADGGGTLIKCVVSAGDD